MNQDELALSFEVLTRALPPRIELGQPWPRDQAWDDYDSPALIHAAAQHLGGQDFLTGGATRMDAFLLRARGMAEPRVIAFWLREATFFANDGGAGIQRLARSWSGSEDRLKSHIAALADHLIEPGTS